MSRARPRAPGQAQTRSCLQAPRSSSLRPAPCNEGRLQASPRPATKATGGAALPQVAGDRHAQATRLAATPDSTMP